MTPLREPPLRKGARAFASTADLLRLKQRATGFSFLPRQPVHSLLLGRHASRLRGRGLNFEELRRYSEGDDTRTIDWLATARLGSAYVRVFTEERDRPVLLLVDQRGSMFFGSQGAMKSVAAADTAALAAWRVTSLGDRIGAIVFGDKELVTIKPQSRDLGAVRILHEVVRQNQRLAAATGDVESSGQLNAALRHADALAKHDWLICLITDGAGADHETERLVTKLTAHNDVIAVFIYDLVEAALPDVGRVVVSSGRRQMEVDSSSASLRSRFSKTFADWRARLAALSRERAIPVLPISTARDAADQLQELIGERSGRSGIRRR